MEDIFVTFVSISFFSLIIISLGLYYVIPPKYRWCVLLLSSIVFYSYSSKRALLLTIAIAFFSYWMAIIIEKMDKGKKKTAIIAIAVIILVSVLGFCKIAGHIKSLEGRFIVPLGISYFSLSIIGYLLDVYWKKDSAEKNLGHYLTFVLYFPKIVQGPISRHKFLQGQLVKGKNIEYREVCYGMQLILWGFFKKIVLADRINILTSNVYSNLEIYEYRGGILLIAMVASAVQLYMDFSGYTDIAIGTSQIFGIELEQNFNHPFFSRSASEFWQRWHMTLSGWFKDYLFLPVSRSKFVKKISKRMGERYSAVARKKTMMVISTAMVWMATGLWHGTGINYIVWGIYWGLIIISSEILESFWSGVIRVLHINTSAPTWKLFQMCRTFCIFVIGKMISAQESLHDVKVVLWGIYRNIHPSDIIAVSDLGLTRLDFYVLIFGLICVFIVSVAQEQGMCIREKISEWNTLPRWFFYSFALSVVLLLGLYGNGYDTSSFAYQFF